MVERTGDPRRLRTVDTVTAILMALADDTPDLGVNEIARRTGLDKSTASRALRTLAEAGFVARVDPAGRYRLGMTLVRLAQVALNGLDLGQRAEPYVERIAMSTGETSHCAVWSQDCAIIIRHNPGTYPIRAPGSVGERMPAHCTSLGKLLLAFQPQEAIDTVLGGTLDRYTPATITDPPVLRAELERIRVEGVAYNRAEYREDAVGVAAAVTDHEARVVAALSVSGPAYRLGTKQLEQLCASVVRPAAAELSSMLGSPANDGQ